MRQRTLLLLALGLGVVCALWLLRADEETREAADLDATLRGRREAPVRETPLGEKDGAILHGAGPQMAPRADRAAEADAPLVPEITGPTLRGRVVDEAGAGVAGVKLRVELHATALRDGTSRKGAGRTPLAEETLVTNADGRFQLLGTHASRCIVHITFAEVPRRFSWPAPRRFAFRDEPVELTLSAGASIAGRVLPHPEWGQPRALIVTAYWLEGGVRRSHQAQGGAYDAVLYQARPEGGLVRGRTHARVRADGSFAFFGLPPGARIALEALPAFELKSATMTIGDRVMETGSKYPAFRRDGLGTARDIEVGRQDVEIALGGGGAGGLDLTVVDEKGRPLADQTLLIEAATTSLLPARRVATSAEGRVLVPGLAAGMYEVQLLGRPGLPPRPRQRVRLPSGPVRLTLAPAPKRRVHGELVDAGTLRGFRVLATGASLNQPLVSLVDAEGRFSFETYADLVDLRVERFGDVRCAHLKGVVPGGKVLRLELQAGASIEGRVFDVDGQPLRAAGWARAFNEEVSVRTAFPGGGRFRIDGLPPGRYTLQAGGGLGSGVAELRDIEAGRSGLELRIPEQR